MSKELWLKPEDGHPDRFDALVGTFEPGSMLHFGPGTYATRGNAIIPQGCMLKGYGNATIESSDDRTQGNAVLATPWNLDGYATVEDIGIDGKFGKIAKQIVAGPRKIDCLVLHGSHNRMNRVRAKGFGGTVDIEKWEDGQEAFGLLMSAVKLDGVEQPQFDNVIRDSFADGGHPDDAEPEFSGNYQNGICGGSLGLIDGCTVANMVLLRDGHAAGIGMKSGQIIGCTTINCHWGAYIEGLIDLEILGCHFLSCHERAICIRLGSPTGTTITNSVLEMRDDATDGVALEMDEAAVSKVTGNTLRIIATDKPSTIRGISGIRLSRTVGRGQIVTGNLLDPRLTNALAPDAVCSGNRTLTGGLVASLPDNPAVMPDKIPKHWKDKLRKTL